MRFISITKPGIIFGNVITLTAGFFLGMHHHFVFLTYLATLFGMALVIACGCVLNNCIDRDIDSLMERTRDRVLVKNLMSMRVALCYATCLGAVGLSLLYFYANPLASFVALFGLFAYVVIYSLYAKRYSYLGTSIGAIAGAIPPVVGYCASSHVIDSGAIILFIILFFWQIPHAYAIAIFRLDDCKAAKIPVLPLRKGIDRTKKMMLLGVAAFVLATFLPTLFGYTGWFYLAIAILLGAYWLYYALLGLRAKNNIVWARKMFSTSVLHITLLCLVMSAVSL